MLVGVVKGPCCSMYSILVQISVSKEDDVVDGTPLAYAALRCMQGQRCYMAVEHSSKISRRYLLNVVRRRDATRWYDFFLGLMLNTANKVLHFLEAYDRF
jgi:hypothetical protein